MIFWPVDNLLNTNRKRNFLKHLKPSFSSYYYKWHKLFFLVAKSFLIGSTGLWIQWGEGVMLYPWHPAQTLAWRRIFNEQSRKGGEEKRKGEKRNMEGGKREQRKEGWREGENEVSSERDLSPPPLLLVSLFFLKFQASYLMTENQYHSSFLTASCWS